MVGTATVIRGDARALPLPDASVDLVVTSPPYFALRSYTDGGEHYPGQIGSEATPAEYIAALLDVTRECVRVLKPGGSIWVDLGDKYDSGTTTPRTSKGQGWFLGSPRVSLGRAKSLMLLPERYRIAAVDQLGLICRAVVIWNKPNGLPESVTDRVRRSHEDWVQLTKAPRYFSAVDAIRELQTEAWRSTGKVENRGTRRSDASVNNGFGLDGHTPREYNPLGKLPGSVWTIPTEPLTVPDHLDVDHFAAFPTEWPRRIILGWSPSGICTVCGEGRRPVHAAERHRNGEPVSGGLYGVGKFGTATGRRHTERTTRVPTGEACACTPYTIEDLEEPPGKPIVRYHFDRWTPAPTRPAVVLDPFGGTGTTALVAKALGRHGIAVDLSADYCRLARWRTTDRGQIAKAMRVDKPPVIPEAQLSLEWEVA